MDLSRVTPLVSHLINIRKECKMEKSCETPQKLFSLPQIAEIYGLKERTIYNWVKNHELPHIRVGSSYLFRVEEVEKWLKYREVR